MKTIDRVIRRYDYDSMAIPPMNMSTNGEFCRWSDIAPLLRLARAALKPDRSGLELREACRKIDAALATAETAT